MDLANEDCKRRAKQQDSIAFHLVTAILSGPGKCGSLREFIYINNVMCAAKALKKRSEAAESIL
jgi:hypothetical protein